METYEILGKYFQGENREAKVGELVLEVETKEVHSVVDLPMIFPYKGVPIGARMIDGQLSTVFLKHEDYVVLTPVSQHE